LAVIPIVVAGVGLLKEIACRAGSERGSGVPNPIK